MAASDDFDERDMHAMIRLLGDLAANAGNHTAKKRQLMDGLCNVIGADFWVWALIPTMIPGELPAYLAILAGGFHHEQYRKFLRAVDHPDMAALTESFVRELNRQQVHLTRARQQIVPAGVFESCAAWKLWQEADIDPILLSSRPTGGGNQSLVAFCRKAGRPLFCSRETRIVHLVLSEVPWLHLVGWPEDRGASVLTLSTRVRTVLNLLIRGLSRKEIATGLGISVQTANDHVKAVFHRFGVHSQRELMNRFLNGDGGIDREGGFLNQSMPRLDWSNRPAMGDAAVSPPRQSF